MTTMHLLRLSVFLSCFKPVQGFQWLFTGEIFIDFYIIIVTELSLVQIFLKAQCLEQGMTSAVAGFCELEGCFTHLVFCQLWGLIWERDLCQGKKKKKRKKRLIFSERQ